MYNHQEIEKKWQNYWYSKDIFKTSNTSLKPKYYVLDMFPYPSGAGLHVGHPEGYTANDIVARYKNAKGYNVLHPMGWDAFGLPAENYAIKTGTHPRITTDQNIATFKRQIKSLGFSYDWNREIDTTDPEYYKWTQWIFLKLFENGLAYEQDLPINYCPSCATGLANEEVLNDNSCERCGDQVEKKKIRQWVLAITKYAERLLADVDDLDWPEGIKDMQRNWIGKSEGCDVAWKVENHDVILHTYTTTVDTIYGTTFAVISPEHDELLAITDEENRQEVQAYIDNSRKKSDLERTELNKDKTGVFTGTYLINPLSGDKVPLYVADYVLMSYGTGVVMGVPAHDQRDMDFAQKYDIDIIQVIESEAGETFVYDDVDKYRVKGQIINSERFNGLGIQEGRKVITEELEKLGKGKKKINYKLRDWLFSRQRYWGEPIPLIHLERDDVRALPRVASLQDTMEAGKAYVLKTEPHLNSSPQGEDGAANLEENVASLSSKEREFKSEVDNRTLCSKGQVKSLVIDGKVVSKIYSGIYNDIICDYNLPLELPEVEEYKPAGDGTSPLTKVESFMNVELADNLTGTRENNTMPQWGGSCWYYLRFMDAKNPEELVGSEIEKYWGNVDSYVGGAEHAVLHLLYARFWHKFLFDIGVVSTEEPFYRLRNQGMILGMSYRNAKGKLIADDLVEERPHPNPLPKGEGTKTMGYFDKETGEELEKIPAKMSKSLKNVINPDDIVREYGADTLRMYEMYMADFKDAAPWDTSSIVGVRRFLDKFYRLMMQPSPPAPLPEGEGSSKFSDEEKMKMLHKTIKKVGEDIENYKFNTAIAQLMILLNTGEPQDPVKNIEWKKAFVQLLHPFAPHMAEECWEQLEVKEETYSKIYFATGNDGKIDRAQVVIDTLSSDIKIEKIPDIIEVEETGKTPLECAMQKIEVYKNKGYDIPIIAADTSIYFENEDLDPTRVRRNALDAVGKKESEVSLEECAKIMIDFYIDIANKAGGKVDFYYIDSFVVLFPNGEIQSYEQRREYILTNKHKGEVFPYAPMRSLYISKITGKRACETKDEDYKKEFECQIEAFAELFDLRPKSVFFTDWPEYDEAMTIDSEVTIGVQVLGKLRGEIQISKDEDKESVLKKAKTNENVLKWIEGKEVVKEIYVPGKIVNLVVK